MGLQIEPDFGRPLEVTGEPQGGVCCDSAFALHDLIDAARRHADVIGESVFGQAQRKEEIFAENFTGMDGGVLFHGMRGLMVIDDFDLMRAV